MTGANSNGRPGVVKRCMLLTLGLGLTIWLIACGGGSSVTPQSGASPLPQIPDIKLSLATTPGGSNVTVALQAASCEELYQLSCRVSYDPDVVTPLEVERGGLVDERAAFFTTAEAAGYVPVAFTYHPGEAIPAAAGAVAVLEFRVIDAGGDPGFGLIADEDFLIANDKTGRRLSVEAEVAK